MYVRLVQIQYMRLLQVPQGAQLKQLGVRSWVEYQTQQNKIKERKNDEEKGGDEQKGEEGGPKHLIVRVFFHEVFCIS